MANTKTTTKKLAKQIARLELQLAQAHSANGEHTKAAELFARHGISYVPSHLLTN